MRSEDLKCLFWIR